MSDYGFATYDEKNPNIRDGVVNSKWPIFGPKYNMISTCFKTYHISDTTTYVAKDVVYPLSPPSADSWDGSHAYRLRKVEILRRKHGFKKRPMGYVCFTGYVVENTRGYIKQYHENGSAALGGDFELNGVNTTTIPVHSSLQDGMQTSWTGNWSFLQNTLNQKIFTIYDGSTWYPEGNIKVPTAVASKAKGTISLWDDQDVPPVPGLTLYSEDPYEVVIDDEDIILYKNIYDCDIWMRTDSGSTRVYDRIKGVCDYAGTELDMTVMLCPYRMEDLL